MNVSPGALAELVSVCGHGDVTKRVESSGLADFANDRIGIFGKFVSE
jgi:hypothetical protein